MGWPWMVAAEELEEAFVRIVDMYLQRHCLVTGQNQAML